VRVSNEKDGGCTNGNSDTTSRKGRSRARRKTIETRASPASTVDYKQPNAVECGRRYSLFFVYEIHCEL
jgi:hypothetical protein